MIKRGNNREGLAIYSSTILALIMLGLLIGNHTSANIELSPKPAVEAEGAPRHQPDIGNLMRLPASWHLPVESVEAELADQKLESITSARAICYASLRPEIYRCLSWLVGSEGAVGLFRVRIAFDGLSYVSHQLVLMVIIGILISYAVITFEHYRAARMKELNAALSESEALTEQLTIQQEELGKVTRILALDYAVTRAMVESPTPVEAALGILQVVCIATGWDAGAIWDVDPRSGVAHCVGVWQKGATDAVQLEALNTRQVFLPGTGLAGRVLASRQSYWVADIVELTGLSRLTPAGTENLRSGFGFPILVGSEVVGILELYSYVVREPDQELIQVMTSVGSHIGQLIQRKRAEDALSRSKEERLRELQRVRRRIATDLHDDVGSSLTKIALLSEAVRQGAIEKNDAASERLDTITSISNELVESMSDIVWAINPQKDYLSDLSQRMRRFASDIFTTRQIAFRFRAPGLERDIQLGANVRREVFLIFKESINNVMKHSDCSEVIMEMDVEDGWLTLSISDNGKGFDPVLVKADTGYLTSQSTGGNGLASMRRRAREMGGQFDILTSKGRGTTMTLRMPIGQSACGISETVAHAVHAGGDRLAGL